MQIISRRGRYGFYGSVRSFVSHTHVFARNFISSHDSSSRSAHVEQCYHMVHAADSRSDGCDRCEHFPVFKTRFMSLAQPSFLFCIPLDVDRRVSLTVGDTSRSYSMLTSILTMLGRRLDFLGCQFHILLAVFFGVFTAPSTLSW